MAPQQDSSHLDVSLQLISDQSLQAVNQLVQQLEALNNFVAQQQNLGPGAGGQPGVPVSHGVTRGAIAPSGRPDVPERPTGPSSGASISEEDKKLRDVGLFRRWSAVRKQLPNASMGERLDKYLQVSLQGNALAEDQSEDIEAGIHQGGPSSGASIGRSHRVVPRAGSPSIQDMASMVEEASRTGEIPQSGPSGGASVAGIDPSAPQAFQNLQRLGISADSRIGMTIPRLGEFTIQDKLNIAARYFGGHAMRRWEAGEGDSLMARTQARVSGVAALGAQNAAAIVAAKNEFQRVGQFVSGMELGAQQLGYSREGPDVGVGGYGFRIGGPFSEAGRRGFAQRMTRLDIAGRSGITMEEANEIEDSLIGLGFDPGRGVGETLAKDVMARLYQDAGVRPEEVGPILNTAARHGNANLMELRDSLLELADSAQSAHLSTREMMEAAAEYAETAQSMGGFYEDAIRNAGTIARAGVDPRLFAQNMTQGITQGVAMTQSGLPPFLQGSLNPAQQAQAQNRTLEMARTVTAGSRSLAGRGQGDITTASGYVIKGQTADEAQVAAMAAMTGYSPEYIRRWMRDPDFLNQEMYASEMLKDMEEGMGATLATFDQDKMEWVDAHGDRVSSKDIEKQLGDGELEQATDANGQFIIRKKGTGQGPTWDQMEAQLLELTPEGEEGEKWRERITEIGRERDPEKRLRLARDELTKVTQVHGEYNGPLLDLTPEARKLVRLLDDPKGPQREANAGGEPVNRVYNGPVAQPISDRAASIGAGG